MQPKARRKGQSHAYGGDSYSSDNDAAHEIEGTGDGDPCSEGELDDYGTQSTCALLTSLSQDSN